MQVLKYNLINGPKETVADYLQTLNNDDLQNTFSSLLLYGIKMPDLAKKMRNELRKRKMDTQAILF
jgi:hypothetical protein